jgi:hypothetical protein
LNFVLPPRLLRALGHPESDRPRAVEHQALDRGVDLVAVADRRAVVAAGAVPDDFDLVRADDLAGQLAPPAERLALASNLKVLDPPFSSRSMCQTTGPFAPTAGSENGAGSAWSLYWLYGHGVSVTTTFCRSTSPGFSTVIV